MSWDNTLTALNYTAPRSISGLLLNCDYTIQTAVSSLGWTLTTDASYSPAGFTCRALALATCSRVLIPKAIDELTSSPEFNLARIAGSINVQTEAQLLYQLGENYEKQLQRMFAPKGSVRILRG